MAAGQERYGTRKIDGETAFDTSKDMSGDPFGLFERFFEFFPRFFATGLFAAQNGFAVPVFHALEVDLDGIANFDFSRLSRQRKFF